MNNSEFINQARKILTEDYTARHTAEYNSWLTGCKNSWMKPHVIVPFPPFVISPALSAFKPSVVSPSEDEVVAKALELYNQFNPVQPTTKVQPIVEAPEPIAEPIAEPISRPMIEAIAHVDEIYKIFQTKEKIEPEEKIDPLTNDTTFTAIEKALNVVPQPAEELAKVSTPGRMFPSVLEKLQTMTTKWSTNK